MLPRVTTRVLTALVFLGGALPPAVSAVDVSIEKLRDHVAFLASDDLGGRDSGEPGLEVAAEYLARVFSDLGLEPAGDRGSFFQHFTVAYGADFGARLGVNLDFGDEVERTWAPWTEAFPMGFGKPGPVDAAVVFAGYGITTGDDDRKNGLEYDDYAGLDVKGKVVVFSLKIVRGDRIGLIGNNGVGKTTLLRLLLGDLEPQTGTLKHGTNLEIGYFDQLRESLDLEKSVAYNVGEGRTYIKLDGKDRHVVGYLKGFLFGPKRSMMPVKALSGGERNRVILAKLFTRAANLLVLDEPTNDLDIETLEVLEDKLCEFSGTLIVVSHDREFLDNVVTSTVVFENDGRIQEYVGGYRDWLRQGHQLAESDNPYEAAERKQAAAERRKHRKPTKLGYKDQRELDQLPTEIEAIETSISELQGAVSEPDFYSQDHETVQARLQQLTDAEALLEQRVERWSELEILQSSYQSR